MWGNTGDIRDGAGAKWMVSPTLTFICSSCLFTASILRFDVFLAGGNPPHALVGDFTVANGTLDVDKSFTITGRLTHSGGRIEVASSRFCTFDFDE